MFLFFFLCTIIDFDSFFEGEKSMAELMGMGKQLLGMYDVAYMLSPFSS